MTGQSPDAVGGHSSPRLFREAVIDLDAIRANVAAIAAQVAPARTMVVVKADAYGHGAVPAARAAVAGGAAWLGVADIDEALALRAAGLDAPILAWLHDPDAQFGPAIEHEVDLGVSSLAQLQAIADAAASVSRRADGAPEDRQRTQPQRRRPRGVGCRGRRGRRARAGRPHPRARRVQPPRQHVSR